MTEPYCPECGSLVERGSDGCTFVCTLPGCPYRSGVGIITVVRR